MERKPNTVLGLFSLSIFIVSLYALNYTKSLSTGISDSSSLSFVSGNNRNFNSDDIEIDYQTPTQPMAESSPSTEPLSSPSSLVAPPALIASNVASSTPFPPQLQYPVLGSPSPNAATYASSMPIKSTLAAEANHPVITNTSIQNTVRAIPLSQSIRMMDPSSMHILSTISQNADPSSSVIVNATPTESPSSMPSSSVPQISMPISSSTPNPK